MVWRCGLTGWLVFSAETDNAAEEIKVKKTWPKALFHHMRRIYKPSGFTNPNSKSQITDVRNLKLVL